MENRLNVDFFVQGIRTQFWPAPDSSPKFLFSPTERALRVFKIQAVDFFKSTEPDLWPTTDRIFARKTKRLRPFFLLNSVRVRAGVRWVTHARTRVRRKSDLGPNFAATLFSFGPSGLLIYNKETQGWVAEPDAIAGNTKFGAVPDKIAQSWRKMRAKLRKAGTKLRKAAQSCAKLAQSCAKLKKFQQGENTRLLKTQLCEACCQLCAALCSFVGLIPTGVCTVLQFFGAHRPLALATSYGNAGTGAAAVVGGLNPNPRATGYV